METMIPKKNEKSGSKNLYIFEGSTVKQSSDNNSYTNHYESWRHLYNLSEEDKMNLKEMLLTSDYLSKTDISINLEPVNRLSNQTTGFQNSISPPKFEVNHICNLRPSLNVESIETVQKIHCSESFAEDRFAQDVNRKVNQCSVHSNSSLQVEVTVDRQLKSSKFSLEKKKSALFIANTNNISDNYHISNNNISDNYHINANSISLNSNGCFFENMEVLGEPIKSERSLKIDVIHENKQSQVFNESKILFSKNKNICDEVHSQSTVKASKSQRR